MQRREGADGRSGANRVTRMVRRAFQTTSTRRGRKSVPRGETQRELQEPGLQTGQEARVALQPESCKDRGSPNTGQAPGLAGSPGWARTSPSGAPICLSLHQSSFLPLGPADRELALGPGQALVLGEL